MRTFGAAVTGDVAAGRSGRKLQSGAQLKPNSSGGAPRRGQQFPTYSRLQLFANAAIASSRECAAG
jgi:hypothetical protein